MGVSRWDGKGVHVAAFNGVRYTFPLCCTRGYSAAFLSLGVKSKKVVAAAMLAVRFCCAGLFEDQTFRKGRDSVMFDGFVAAFCSLIPDWKRDRDLSMYLY
jgi:hypothetical protein